MPLFHGEHLRHVILLVDDEPDLIGIFSEVLELQMPEYRVQNANSCESAIDALDILAAQSRQLALVIADHQLGDMNGLELLREVHARHPAVPRILHTGRASAEVELQARNTGAIIMRKPVSIHHWIGTVRDALGRSSGSAGAQPTV